MDIKDLWNHCLVEIEAEVSKANFSTWFRNTSLVKEDAGTVFVGVPNEFVKDWLSNKFHKLIMRVLRNSWEHTRNVEYIVIKTALKNSKTETVTPFLQQNFAKNQELPLNDLYINKEDNLNPRYTFETFIVGSFNELAYAATQAAVARPGKQYNPLFIYGSTGLGKTHLIQAVGNAIKEKYPGKKVFYMTQEKFTVDYINSVQANRGAGNAFKEKYRKYDAIIIDDVQMVGKAEKTQEELFHLFNSFYENGKQIVFSSDKHPNFIPGIEDRLRSRFAQGMIVDITDPDYESRLAILRSKLRDLGLNMPDEISDYIATVIQGNIRELEGCLNSIVLQTQTKGRFPTLLETKNLLKNSIKQKKSASVKEVVKTIADFYSIEETSVYEKTRRKEIVKVRQIVMFVLREDFNVSYPMIGQKLGGKDHTTVIHSCDKIREDIKQDMALAQEVEQIRGLFK